MAKPRLTMLQRAMDDANEYDFIPVGVDGSTAFVLAQRKREPERQYDMLFELNKDGKYVAADCSCPYSMIYRSRTCRHRLIAHIRFDNLNEILDAHFAAVHRLSRRGWQAMTGLR